MGERRMSSSEAVSISRRKWIASVVGGVGAGTALWGCNGMDKPPVAKDIPLPKRYKARIVKSYPHDPTAYTQGLLFKDGFLYESTGKYDGQSSLRKVEIKTGRALKQHKLKNDEFGEGLTLWGDQLFQITWENEICYVYDLKTFKQIKTFDYNGDGWGLTHNGKHLIMSDGSFRLYFRDPKTFDKVSTLKVQSSSGALASINELEYYKGELLANVYGDLTIYQISLSTGHVTGTIDCSQLLTKEEWGKMPPMQRMESVLNGIAYDKKDNRLFVTGKNWPRLFEIELVAL